MSQSTLPIQQQVLMSLLFLGILVIAVQIAFVLAHRRMQQRLDQRAQRVHQQYEGAIMALLAADADSEAQDTFLAALPTGRVEKQLVVQDLLNMARTLRGPARDGIVRVLAESGVATDYVEMLTSRHARQRALAAEMLGEIEVRAASRQVLHLLDDPEEEVRIVAARALGKLGDATIAAALLRAFATDKVPSGIVSQSILRLGWQTAPTLVTYLEDAMPEIRALCAELLGILRYIEAVGDLEYLLLDSSSIVRISAARSLGVLGCPTSATALRNALQREEHHATREAILTALGQIGHPGAIPSLLIALYDSEQTIRVAAAEALVALGEPGIAVLRNTLESPPSDARAQCVEALERSGYVDEMERTLRAGTTRERAEAARFLRALVAAGGGSVLDWARITDDELTAAEEAAGCLSAPDEQADLTPTSERDASLAWTSAGYDLPDWQGLDPLLGRFAARTSGEEVL